MGDEEDYYLSSSEDQDDYCYPDDDDPEVDEDGGDHEEDVLLDLEDGREESCSWSSTSVFFSLKIKALQLASSCYLYFYTMNESFRCRAEFPIPSHAHRLHKYFYFLK